MLTIRSDLKPATSRYCRRNLGAYYGGSAAKLPPELRKRKRPLAYKLLSLLPVLPPA